MSIIIPQEQHALNLRPVLQDAPSEPVPDSSKKHHCWPVTVNLVSICFEPLQ